MPERLATAAGEVLDVDRTEVDFAAAMAAPPADKPGMAAPARKPPEPDPDPQKAPHGWTFTDGEWRAKKAPGRPRSTGDKPRVTNTPPASTPPPSRPETPKVNYLKPLRETGEALWFMLASVPVPEQAFGYKLGRLRVNLRVQAALIESNVDALAAGVNTVAQHNRFVARAVARLASGEGGLWVLPAVMMLAPFIAQTGQLWSGQLADVAELDAIAAQTEAQVSVYLEKLAEAGVAAAAEASAAPA